MAVIAVAVLALDQATKSWAVAALAGGRTIDVFWTLELDLAFNPGLAFSQGTGLTGLITIVGLSLVAGIVWWSRGVTSPLLAVDRLADGPVDVVWTLRFNLAFNSGLSFGQGKGLTAYITVLGVVLVCGLVWWSRQLTTPASAGSVGLLLGGACGNLADRLFRGHDGAVVDFIDFQWWPVFNVADIAVFCGAALLILVTLREAESS